MPTLSVNQSTTDRLEVGKVLNMVLPANSQLLVDMTGPSGTVIRYTQSASGTLGPFMAELSYKVTCSLGSADVYESWRDQVQPVGYSVDLTGRIGSLVAGGRDALEDLFLKKTGQIATRCEIPNNVNATFQSCMSRSVHLSMDAVSLLSLVLPNFYTNNSVIEAGSGGIATIKASIEKLDGTIFPVTFSGATSATVADNSYVVSDAVSVNLARLEKFFVRVFFQNPVAIVFNNRGGVPLSNGDFFAYAAGINGTTDRTSGGAITNTTSIAYALYRPLAIIGSTSKKSYLLIGDSKVNGTNDANTNGQSGFGELERPISKVCAYTAVGIAGSTIQTLTQNASGSASRYAKIKAIANAYFSGVISNYGINDFSGGITSAQVIACYADFKTQMAMPVIACTVCPKVPTTSDGYATVANQTVDGTSNPNRVAFNGALRAGQVAVDAYLELADIVESTRDSGKWKAAAATVSASTSGSSTTMTIASIGSGSVSIGQWVAATTTTGAFISSFGTFNGTSGTVILSSALNLASATYVLDGFTGDGTHETPNGYKQIEAELLKSVGMLV
jgi:lysophospholipase L1-like esterase